MKGKRQFACALAALLTMMAGQTVLAAGTLKVGVRGDIMNFGYYNETTGKYYGMEIDLAEELAGRLGYSGTELIRVTPDDRKEMLLNGEVDCLIAAYSIADTRLENFDFSEPYYRDYSRIMVERSTLFTELKDLRGKKIGVLEGADTAPVFASRMAELGLASGEEDITFIRLESYEELNRALEEGTVDAACMDGCIAAAYMNEERLLLEETLAEENYGVATQKDSELSDKVAEQIRQMLQDGTIDALIDKWD